MPKLGRALDTVLDRTVVGGYPKWGLALRKRLPDWPKDVPADALAGCTAMVTGASSGLGIATATAFADLGATVHLVVRDLAKGERVAENIPNAVVSRCDVSDLDDVTRFAETVQTSVDVLVHNAGVLPPQRQTTAQDHEVTMATHVLGPLRMTELMRPALTGGRVIWVSSGGMYGQKLPLSDPEYRLGDYRGATAYARTKRVQVALTPVLAKRWAPDGIAVYTTHPGWADTPGVAGSLPLFHRLTGPFLRNVEDGADTTVWLAAADPAPESGLFWHDRRPRDPHLVPWTRHDDAAAEQMFAWCAKKAGLTP